MTDQHGENPEHPAEPVSEGSGPAESSAPMPPPAAPAAPSGGGSQYDFTDAKATLEGANKLDLGIIAAGLVALIGSWLPFYTYSVGLKGVASTSGSLSAWHGFFGWFAVLIALAASVAVALALFDVVKLPMPVHQIAVAGFGLAFLLLILTLLVDPSGGCNGVSGFGVSCDFGRGFGFWLAVLAVLAGAGLSFLRMRESDASVRTA